MKLKNKKVIYVFLYLASFALSFGILVLVNKIEIIPIINNLFIGFGFLLFICLQIFSLYNFTKFNINKYGKIILCLLILILGLIFAFYLFLASVFSGKENRTLIYAGEKYYILNLGWLDPIYEVYEKNFITMDKLDEKNLGKVFSDLSKVEDKDQREILKFLIYGREDFTKEENKEANENHQVEEKAEGKNLIEDKKKLLKNFTVEDAVKIENSDYGLLEVDSAGARSRWFFVKIKGDKMNFISELKDTSPEVSGRVDENGNIYLKFTDINKNETSYLSKNGGKTFEEWGENMEIILGIIAIFFAIKNIIAWTQGKDPQKYRFLSLAFTSLTIFSFYYMGADFLSKGDIAGALDVVPTISKILFFCTIASIIINGITLFKKK